jgi:hypothetical protein
LFQYAVEKLPSSQKALKTSLLQVGLCHAKGVKDVSRVSPMLELAGRECFIVSDGDKVAIEHQRKYDGYGTWIRYDELIQDPVVTAEDFIRPEAFRATIERLRSENPSLPELTNQDLDQTGRLSVVHKWLTENGIDEESAKPMLNGLKQDIFSNLKPSYVEPKYFELLEALGERLKSF